MVCFRGWKAAIVVASLLSADSMYRQISSPPHLPCSELDQVALESRCGRPAGVGVPFHP